VKKKLSYIEARDYETIEHRVAEAEVALEAQHDAVQAAASIGGKELEAAMKELEKRQLAVDELYERWAELEGKLK
jgi:ATP-binding cassette subfamily F protein uup